MNLMQISNSRRSVTVATALIGVLSLAIGAHAALNQRTTVIPDVVSVEQSVEIPAKASRIALVIGNGHYPDANTPLAQPINDARGLTTSLRHDGFDVEVVEDASKDDMDRAIARLKSKIKPDSVVMVFFGGYGQALRVAGRQVLRTSIALGDHPLELHPRRLHVLRAIRML